MTALKSVSQAIESMCQAVSNCLPSTERLPLTALDGRILALPISSSMTVPAFDNSAMDGYAIRFNDRSLLTSSGLKVVGEALAGHPYEGEILPGEAIRIFTGAQLPASLDTVIMQEEIDRSDDLIFTTAPIKEGQNVRYAGEDIAAGEQILVPGQRLTPLHIGLLASIGIAEVEVYKKLKVALFSSGDELCQPGEQRRSNQIYDSNRYALKAMLERLPVEVVHFQWLPDDYNTIRNAIATAANEADVIITSAGVSVGDADYTKQVIDELGEVGFWKVAMKPGKPFAFGKLKNSWFFGLPGNPVSAIATLDQLAQPALRSLCGEQYSPPAPLTAVATDTFKKRPGRTDFQRVVIENASGQLNAAPYGNQGSALLRGFANAQGYAVLEAERGKVEVGEPISVQPFGSLLN